MCMISVVMQDAQSSLQGNHPWALAQYAAAPPSRLEFEALKRDVEALKKLLEAAKKYDAATGQPDCEHPEKVKLIRDIARVVGVDLSEVLAK